MTDNSLILAIDIEGFARPADAVRILLRQRLQSIIDQTLAASEIPRDSVRARSDLGDGLLLIIRPYIPATWLTKFILQLAIQLRSHNQLSRDASRLRLRVAIHQGEILEDAVGYTGAALIYTFRLLDAQVGRSLLRSTPAADMAVLLSSSIWQSLSVAAPAMLEFEPIEFHTKGISTQAWIHLHGANVSTSEAMRPMGFAKVPVKDFLIVHTAADQAWAEWIAWQLRKAGYTTLLKTWDFQRSDFVRDLSQATSECDRTLVVLSETYQDAAFAYPEWAVAFSRDPLGEKGLLIPVKVESCETTELLGPLSYIDLTGLEEKAAALALLDGVKGTRRGMNAPAFPGQGLRPPS